VLWYWTKAKNIVFLREEFVMKKLISILILCMAAMAAAVGTPLVWSDATMTADAHYWHHDNYHPRRTVNGDGMDVTGLLATYNTPNRWSDAEYGHDIGNPHLGTVAGNTWISHDFGQVFNLTDMWVWNNSDDSYLTSRGLRNVTIEYSLTGGPTAGEWSTAWTGDFNPALGTYPDPYAHETEINFGSGGIDARYVVITAHSTWGEVDYVGLAEVRYFVPEPATIALLGLGGLALRIRKRS
jgi:hypothetical protein